MTLNRTSKLKFSFRGLQLNKQSLIFNTNLPLFFFNEFDHCRICRQTAEC